MLFVTKRKDGVDIRTSIVIPIELWRRARAVTGPKELRKVILEGLEKRVAELESEETRRSRPAGQVNGG